jgi:hypothetical protein
MAPHRDLPRNGRGFGRCLLAAADAFDDAAYDHPFGRQRGFSHRPLVDARMPNTYMGF